MKIGSLFSGGGLGDFGFLAAGMEIAWQCEIDLACQKRLALRYPESKKYIDIRNLKGAELEKVDIITGGFPCQPFSNAGAKRGKDDNRYLWPEMLRVIKECQPRWIVGENVAGILNMAQFDCEPKVDSEGIPTGDIGDLFHRRGSGILDEILETLKASGYEAWPVVFPSHALGAWHKRDRIWILAHAGCAHGTGETFAGEHQGQGRSGNASQSKRSDQCDRPGIVGDTSSYGWNDADKNTGGSDSRGHIGKGTQGSIQASEPSGSGCCDGGDEDMANPNPTGCKKRRGPISIRSQHSTIEYSGQDRWREFWKSEPRVGRVVNGCADRVDRLKMLGNGQVPACTYVIGKMIMEIENENQKSTS